jgi:adenylate cyclase
VTLLLTDIVDSTAVTEKLGDERARELFLNHDRSVRSALAANRGLEVKHTGDGILAVFESVADALTCAVDIQRTLRTVTDEDNGLNIRVGMTSGEPLPEGGDLYGMAVNVAARVCGVASGGQIVVTNVVRELAIGKNFTFLAVGERRLRGIRQPTFLWEVDWRS